MCFLRTNQSNSCDSAENLTASSKQWLLLTPPPLNIYKLCSGENSTVWYDSITNYVIIIIINIVFVMFNAK